MNRALYARRRFTNSVFLMLSVAAAAFGIVWLGLILYSLVTQGIQVLSWDVFTKMTPAQGSTGGLANAIGGSLIMSVLAVIIGTPIGILGGTYLAEYGRHNTLSVIVRFINDILLSAPSILIGLFVYQLVVFNLGFEIEAVPLQLTLFHYTFLDTTLPLPFVPQSALVHMGFHPIPLQRHFSAIAGAMALTVIVIPVVVRTTENMLLLVPNTLREAAAALGTPRNHVIRTVTWRAARAGIVTGVLLAVARISGETAPLIFTAFGNTQWSTDLSQPMASLPKVIFDFAGSADDYLHKLAWTGALIITFAVLTMSILARLFESQRES
jgi:phosphate transport system permease protein